MLLSKVVKSQVRQKETFHDKLIIGTLVYRKTTHTIMGRNRVMNIRGVIFTFAVVFLLAACAPATTSTSVSEKQDLTEAERLLERREQEGSSVWADGNTLTFVYEGEAESVELCCGFQEPLTRLPDGNVWTLSKTIPNISEAIFSYFFIIDGVFPETEQKVWRGANASPEPQTLEPSPGRVFERTLTSEILGEDRKIIVYLPPDHEALKPLGLPVVYLADGGTVWGYASLVEPLIRAGVLPQLILVGIESGEYKGDPNAEYDPSLDMRYREYIPSEDDDRFALHERFVIDEVLPWAEETFGASSKREERVVYGHSNGGVFAAAMGLRNSDVFAYALPFSVGVDPSKETEMQSVMTKFYFVSGELEDSFFTTTRDLAARLADEGIVSTFTGRIAGHDFVMWEEEFLKGLTWVFEE
jgi:enterochelin esterase-like enzyme